MLLTAPLPGRPGSVVKALFDGHGGHVVARKCSVMVPTFLGEAGVPQNPSYVAGGLAHGLNASKNLPS